MDTGEYENSEPYFDANDVGEELSLMHLSLNALNGAFKPTVMRLVGTHGRKSIHILVDSDSAHNFLSEKTTYRLGCALKSVEVAKVLVANDQKLLWNMVCEGFE